ncbi:hypothetical protein BHE74_00020845 [Ensete ventricosum]|nr:hypothetical protein GW17_00043092 [Ensete ventricosum]RWW71413.1 hypothetical protein BHE74_00020845 [Ensete ventricosum]RZR99722.1 hypothetical protein BHM03_00029323 [Ensete ventricosum]
MPTPAAASAVLLSPESLSAAGRAADKLSFPALQSKMKCDPEGYVEELQLCYRLFESSLFLFRQQSTLNPSYDPSLAKDLGDLTMFLAHVTPFYPDKLANFPRQMADLLRVDSRALPSSLRCHLAQALILLVNRKICPSLLVKKDRGRPVNPKARPKAYGEVSIATDVPDIELLEHVDNSMTDSSDAEASASDLDDECDSDAEPEKGDASLEDEEDDEVSDEKNEEEREEDLGNSDNIDREEDDGDDLDDDIDEKAAYDEHDSDTTEDADLSDDNMDISSELDALGKKSSNDICNDDDLSNHECASDDNDEIKEGEKAKSQKRKFADYVGQLNTSESSLRSLKRLTMAKMSQKASDETDGILSNEDFQRIKELKVCSLET